MNSALLGCMYLINGVEYFILTSQRMNPSILLVKSIYIKQAKHDMEVGLLLLKSFLAK